MMRQASAASAKKRVAFATIVSEGLSTAGDRSEESGGGDTGKDFFPGGRSLKRQSSDTRSCYRGNVRRIMFRKSPASLGGKRSPRGVVPMEVVRFFRQPLTRLVCRVLLIAVASCTFLTLLVRHAREEARYSRRDLTPYSSCSVFFLEVSTRSHRHLLSPLQECAVESAARAHPRSTVCLVAGEAGYRDLSALDGMKQQLSALDNVVVIPLDLEALFRWTPLSSWWQEEFKYEIPAEEKREGSNNKNNPWRKIHLADAARLALLWKYGGLYLDLDVLVLRPLFSEDDDASELSSSSFPFDSSAWVGLQHFSPLDGANTAAMRFPEASHPLLSEWLFEVPVRYRQEERACIGPIMLTDLIKKRCLKNGTEVSPSDPVLLPLSDTYCNFGGEPLRILGPKHLYPVPWPEWKTLLSQASSGEGAKVLRTLQEGGGGGDSHKVASRTLHTWNELSGVSLQRGLVAPEGSALEEVARGRCPAAVEKTGKASPALGKEKDSNKLQ